MEIFQLLDNLEDLIENSKKVPLSDKSMIDKDEILEVLKEIRIKLPDELKQAKWVKEERERILAEAQKEADDVVKEAENRIISIIDEHEITKKAYEQKDHIRVWLACLLLLCLTDTADYLRLHRIAYLERISLDYLCE